MFLKKSISKIKLTDFSQTKDAIHCKADLRLKYLNPGQKILQAGRQEDTFSSSTQYHEMRGCGCAPALNLRATVKLLKVFPTFFAFPTIFN